MKERKKQILIRVTSEEKEKLMKTAEENGMSLSSYIRYLGLRGIDVKK